MDVFSEEIPVLPPKSDIDFTIELIPRETSLSKSSYHVSIHEVTELKI